MTGGGKYDILDIFSAASATAPKRQCRIASFFNNFGANAPKRQLSILVEIPKIIDAFQFFNLFGAFAPKFDILVSYFWF